MAADGCWTYGDRFRYRNDGVHLKLVQYCMLAMLIQILKKKKKIMVILPGDSLVLSWVPSTSVFDRFIWQHSGAPA